MKRSKIIPAVIATSIGVGAIGAAYAGMFDMMNPSRWFGGNRDYYDYDRYGRYGYGGPHGYGPYGYGGGPYGYGPYGYGGGWGHPGYGGYPSTIVVNPRSEGGSKATPRLPE